MTYKWPSAAERDAIEHLVKLRPLDTSTLGPIRVDLSQVTSRARLVRQALLHIGDPAVAPSLPIEDRYAAREMANASDETLAMLGRMLR